MFGELYFQATDTIKFTVGLRYNDDKKKTSDTSVLFNSLNVCSTLSPTGAFNGFLQGCGTGQPTPGIQWQRSTLASYYTTAFTGGAVPPTADALALANYYGVNTKFNAALAAGGPLAAFNAINTLNGVPPVPGFNEQRILTGSPSEADWQETTGRGVVDWQYSDHGMLYASYSRGYKPGGFNPPLNASFVASTTAKYTFEPEKVDAFEIGSKHTFMDGCAAGERRDFLLRLPGPADDADREQHVDQRQHGCRDLRCRTRGVLLSRAGSKGSRSTSRTRICMRRSMIRRRSTRWIGLLAIRTSSRSRTSIRVRTPASTSSRTGRRSRRRSSTPRMRNAGRSARRTTRPAACARPGGAGAPYRSSQQTRRRCIRPSMACAIPAYMSKSFLQGQGVTVSDGFDTDLDGNRLPQSPEHKFHIGVAYTISTSFATITPRIDYAWQDESYAREFNTRRRQDRLVGPGRTHRSSPRRSMVAGSAARSSATSGTKTT